MVKVANTVEGFVNQFDVKIEPSVIEELNSLIKSNNYYPYEVDNRVENATFTWSVYGDFKNNRLFVEMNMDDGNRYAGRINSNVLAPNMESRIMGLDQSDAHFAGLVSDWMVAIYTEGLTLDQVKKKAGKQYNREDENDSPEGAD
jgi:hypothetical protein